MQSLGDKKFTYAFWGVWESNGPGVWDLPVGGRNIFRSECKPRIANGRLSVTDYGYKGVISEDRDFLC
jgi:hypothetical protein